MINITTANWVRIVVIIAVLYLLSQVTVIYLPVILSLVLAFALNPLVNFFIAVPIWPFKKHLPRGVAVLLSFFCVTLFIYGVLAFLLAPFIVEFYKFLADLPALVSKLKGITLEIEKNAYNIAIPDNIHTIVEQLVSGATSYSLDLVKRMVNTAFNFASGVIELVVVPVLTYYFLKDGSCLKEEFLHLLPYKSKQKAQEIVEEMSEVISQYIRGQILVSFVIGLMVFAGMYILGVDYPMILGLLAMLTETVPIIGPIVGSIPAVLLAYTAGPALTVKVILFYIVIHQLENHIVVPKIMGHSIAIHPVMIIISFLIGGKLFGVVGMMLAVPAAALIRVLIKHLWDKER
ncbi:putative membrane protein [Propionispora sp. 2/2-37]|uniref:AI-2E family transporter n=1 Tax=Propionispora sp. 2/2-37 TaxID=1677858 RepID=UPI0006BB6447|nr:AI-2E family transporter [Propionispora sp. 2/2-37]CUH94122.1 putative membrane protein [Propionispora sp. 2/2-37]